MPFDIEKVFGPKNIYTPEQLELVNDIRSKFLQLGLELSRRVHNNTHREKGFEQLKEALHSFERAVSQGGVLTPSVLADAYASVEAGQKMVTDVWMNARTFADIRKFGRDIFDAETKMDILKTGLQGRIWSANIHCSRTIPDYHIVLIGTGEPNLTQGATPKEDQLYRF